MLYRLAQLYALEGRRDRAAELAEHALRHAVRAGARVGAARIRSMLAGLLEQIGDRRRADELREQAIEEMRRLGDRRGTAELLLDGARPSESFTPITSASLREAEELAQEIGWVEGERRARQVVSAGRLGRSPLDVPLYDDSDQTAAVVSRTETDLSSASLSLPLVGREQELERLVEFLRASGGESALQLVGPRGSGRSRLVNEAMRQLEGRGMRFAIARPDPSGLGRPFHPLTVAVRELLGLDPIGRTDRLSDALDDIGLTGRDVPAIAELLGQEGPLWQLEPPVRRREILASLGRLLASVAEQSPLALVLEDVNLYDHPSQDAIRQLIEGARGRGRLRILVTNDPVLADMWPPALARIELGPLDPDAIDELLRALHDRELGNDQPSPDQLASACAGLPGHIHQLLRYVVEGGSAASAPSGLADLVAARIDHLPQAAKVLCQAIAVLGVQAPLAVVRALVHDPDDAQLRQALSILVARGLVFESADGGELYFASGLLRDVVYDATPAHVRRDLHELAARSLEQSGAEPSLLGHHFELCGALPQAARYMSQAGDDSVHELDDAGARRLYHRALSAARQLMLSDDEPVLQAQFVGIAVKLAEQLRVGGELGLARGLLDEVRMHCRDSRALQAQILRAAAHLWSAEGDHAAASGALREAIGMAIVTGQRDLICDLYLDMATAHLRESLAHEAISELQEGVNLVTGGEGGRATEGPISLWRMLYRLAQLYALEGRRDRAAELADHALRHAMRAGARLGMARIRSMLAGLLEQIGDRRRADELRDQAIDEMRRLGDRRGTAELLLDGARPSESFTPITSASLREAEELAQEIGWLEGERRARQVVTPPRRRRLTSFHRHRPSWRSRHASGRTGCPRRVRRLSACGTRADISGESLPGKRPDSPGRAWHHPCQVMASMQLPRSGSAAGAVLLSALFLSCSQPPATKPSTPSSAAAGAPAAGAPHASGGPSASAPIFRLPGRRPPHPPAGRGRGGAGPRSLLRPRGDRAAARPAAPGSVDLGARAGPDPRDADARRQGAAAALREGRHPRRRPHGAARARRRRQGDAGHRVQRGVQPAPGRPVPGEGGRPLVRVHAVRGHRRAARVPLLRRAVLQDPVGGRADRAEGRRGGLQHAGRRREAGRRAQAGELPAVAAAVELPGGDRGRRLRRRHPAAACRPTRCARGLYKFGASRPRGEAPSWTSRSSRAPSCWSCSSAGSAPSSRTRSSTTSRSPTSSTAPWRTPGSSRTASRSCSSIRRPRPRTRRCASRR